ncbi:phage major capsid protein [Microbacterium sp. NPDC055455]
MAITNFVPDLWSAKILVALRKKAVAAGLVNRDYEGEIKRMGDSVKITSINDVTIGSYTAHSDITWEDIDDATRSLLIDQAKYFAFELDDIERAQAVNGGAVMNGAIDNATYQLRDTLDTFLLSTLAAGVQGTSNDLGTVAIHTTARNLYDSFVDLAVKLDESNVPEEGRWAVLKPSLHGRLLKLDEFIQAGDSASPMARLNGFIGEIAGLSLFKSNNMPTVTDAAATGGAVIAGHGIAATVAEQIVSVEAVRRENRFADGVKGLHVYGAKVVRPTALATVEFDATA